MTLCRLCGYQTRILDAADPYCPVCGNKYASRGGNDDAAQASPQVPQESTSFDGADPSGTRSPECLDPELQALLQLLPRKLDKERKQEDVIRAACKLNPGQSATHDNKFGEVYIRRRADPTMSALKGRYNTEPCVRRSASMNALHRLAHPLAGYDSTEALCPKARMRRQEAIQRLLDTEELETELRGRGHRSEHMVTERKRLTMLRRRQHDPGALAAHAVQRRLSGATRISISLPMAGNQQPGNGRRARATFRRKRIATMRNVNGWVRKTDPGSMRRCKPPLRQRALGSVTQVDEHLPHADVPYGYEHQAHPVKARRQKDSDTFLTAIDTESPSHVGASEEPCEVKLPQGGKVDARRWRQQRDVETRTHVRLWNAHGRMRSAGVRRGCGAWTVARGEHGATRASKTGTGRKGTRASETSARRKHGLVRRALPFAPKPDQHYSKAASNKLRRKSLLEAKKSSRRRGPTLHGSRVAPPRASRNLIPTDSRRNLLSETANFSPCSIPQRSSMFREESKRFLQEAPAFGGTATSGKARGGPHPAWDYPNPCLADTCGKASTRRSYVEEGGAVITLSPGQPISAWQELRNGTGPTFRSASVLASFKNKVEGGNSMDEEERRSAMTPTALSSPRRLLENWPGYRQRHLQTKRQYSNPNLEAGVDVDPHIGSDYQQNLDWNQDRDRNLHRRWVQDRIQDQIQDRDHNRVQDRSTASCWGPDLDRNLNQNQSQHLDQDRRWIWRLDQHKSQNRSQDQTPGRPSPRSVSSRRELIPSLLMDRTNSPSNHSSLAPTSIPRVTITRHPKRRSTVNNKSAGRMLRLNRSPATVAHVWGMGVKEAKGWGTESLDGPVATTGIRGTVIEQVKTRAGSMEGTSGRRGRRACGGGLSEAVPQPLLYVGTGDTFKI